MTTDPVVLVDWYAHLPGTPSRDEVLRQVEADALGHLPAFEEAYPVPAMTVTGLPPRTARRIDRTQLMALEAVAGLRDRCGALWSEHAGTTGVLIGTWEPLRHSLRATVRGYAPALRRIAAALRDSGQPTAGEAVTDGLDRVLREVPPFTGEVTPGLMANVTAARVANRWDLHGLTLAVGSGRDAVLHAVALACDYLRTGQLDVALVLGVNGNTSPLAARLTGVPADRTAEGAFVFALARSSLARERGLLGLAEVETVPRTPGHAARRSTPTRSTSPAASFLSADGAVDVLRALSADSGPAELRGADGSPLLRVTVLRPPPSDRSEAPALVRLGLEYVRDAGTTGPEPLDALPRAALVLTNRARLAARLVADTRGTDIVVVCADPERAVPGAVVAGTDGWTTLEAAGVPGGSWRDIRVIADLSGPSGAAPSSDIRRLHELAFLAAGRLRSHHPDGGSFLTLLLSATRYGSPAPAAGLFTGMAASLALDLPTTRFATLATDVADLDTGLALLARESALTSPPTGACVRGGHRYVARLAALDPVAPGTRAERPVVVAVGGGRGITAACVRALADTLGPTVWILGRTDFDAVPRGLLLGSDKDFDARVPELTRSAVRADPPGGVAAARRHIARLRAARETHRTLTDLRATAGDANVHYLTCDVRDQAAVTAAARRILATTDRIDLLVNGAGVRHGAAPERKPLSAFREVVGTKVDGHHHLKSAFGPHVRHWYTFGSVVGPLGLVGEADYGAANAYLENAARAAHAQGRNDCTIVWPVWAETGMGADPLVQATVAGHVGLAALDPAEGAARFLAEAAAQAVTRTPVVLPLGPDDSPALRQRFPNLLTPASAPAAQAPGAFGLRPEPGSGWRCELDLAHHPYLLLHTVDGRPTVPASCILEMAAEAALATAPGGRVLALENAVFSAFVRPHAGTGRVVCRLLVGPPTDGGPTDQRTRRVGVRVLRDPATTRTPGRGRGGDEYARVDVLLAAGGPLPADGGLLRLPELDGLPPGPGEAVPDPYTLPMSPVVPRGPFRSTRDCRAHLGGGTAGLRLPGAEAVSDRGVLPALTLDAMLRTSVLDRSDPRGLPIAVPVGIGRILMEEFRSDRRIAELGADVTLRARRDDVTGLTGCVAVTRRGKVIAAVTGVHAHVKAWAADQGEGWHVR